jgi:phage terminase large subunit
MPKTKTPKPNSTALALLEQHTETVDELLAGMGGIYDEEEAGDLNGEDIQDLASIIRKDPKVFLDDYLGIDLWEKQYEILLSVRDHMKTAVKSCHGAGKTFDAAVVALWFMFAYPPAIVIDTAPTGRQVKNQFWREFRRLHGSAKVALGGKVNTVDYTIDENWFALGFSTNATEEGVAKFQGWHGQHLLFIIDEASGVSPFVFQAIEGAMSGGAVVRLLMIGNPNQNTGEFADAFKAADVHKITISAYDTPNVMAGEVVVSGLVTKDWVENMVRKYGLDSDIVRVRVLGEFPKKNSDTLITLDLVEKAIDADREEYGEEEVIGLDPSRKGKDPAAFVYRKGNKAKVLEVIDKCDTMELVGKAVVFLKQYPKAILKIDVIGLGGPIFDRMRELASIQSRVYAVNVALPATDTEEYVNVRAEGWDDTKAWLRDAILEQHEGWYELCGPKYKFTSRGQIQLESKEDMEKRGVPSPNIGDALALTFQRASEGESWGITAV